MQYHLDTIPVWDAFHEGGECPLCSLQEKLEQDFVDLALGGAAMEPDVRIASNEKGYCARHLTLLYQSQRRLPMALVVHTHLMETHARLKPALERAASPAPAKGGLFSKKAAEDPIQVLEKALEKAVSTCVMCERIESNMDQYLYTVLHLYQHDAEFQRTFQESAGFCLPHTRALLDMADKHMHGAKREAFAADLARIQEEALTRLEGELYQFTQMFDYRSQGKDFGSSRDALPRTMTKLRGGVTPEKNG